MPPGLLRPALGAWLAVLGASAAVEALVAAGLIGLGDAPGEDAPLRGPLLLLAVASLVGGGIALIAAAIGRSGALARADARLLAAAPLVAAALLVAHGLAYDAYFAPARRRAIDGGDAWPGVVAVVALLAVAAAAVLAWGRPRAAAAAVGGVVLLIIALTLMTVGGGH